MRPAPVILLLCVALLCVYAPGTMAAPDRVTGGVTVPNGTRTGGGAVVADPLPPAPVAQRSVTAGASPPAYVAQDEAPEPEPPDPEPGNDTVEVEVPVKDQENAAAAAPLVPPTAEPGGGLAQTGFPVAALAAVGALTAAAGLTLRRRLRG